MLLTAVHASASLAEEGSQGGETLCWCLSASALTHPSSHCCFSTLNMLPTASGVAPPPLAGTRKLDLNGDPGVVFHKGGGWESEREVLPIPPSQEPPRQHQWHIWEGGKVLHLAGSLFCFSNGSEGPLQGCLAPQAAIQSPLSWVCVLNSINYNDISEWNMDCKTAIFFTLS